MEINKAIEVLQAFINAYENKNEDNKYSALHAMSNIYEASKVLLDAYNDLIKVNIQIKDELAFFKIDKIFLEGIIAELEAMSIIKITKK